jgi:ABC-type lipoprotein export system ATPase subunit
MDFLIKDLIKLNDYPTVEKLAFHKEISNIFKKDNLLFDTLFYGPSGSGKNTLIFSYLQKIFGKQVIDMVPNIDNKTTQEMINFNMEKVGSILTNHNLTLINDSVNDETIQDFLTKFTRKD